MGKYIFGTALIPASERDRINAALKRYGYGEDNFSIPLGTSSVEYYAACGSATTEMVGILTKLCPEIIIETKSLQEVLAERNLSRLQ